MDFRKFLSEEDCKIILKKIVDKPFLLSSVEIVPFHRQFEGFIGEHLTLRIAYQETSDLTNTTTKTTTIYKTHQFFLKNLNGKNKVMFELSKTINVYEKEEFFYTTLIKVFKQVGLDVTFAPESYFFKPYVTILEDLSLKQFKSTKKCKPLNLNYCQSCLITLAKFHGAGIAYENIKSQNYGYKWTLLDLNFDILQDKVVCNEDNGATKYLKCSIQGLFQLIDFIEIENKEIFKEKLQKYFNNLLNNSQMDNDNDDDNKHLQIKTILHGDLWSNNFLFYFNNDEIIDNKLIDYQTIKYGPPQLDLMQFIMTNTNKQFRDKYQLELIDFYYNQLDKVAGPLILNRQQFQNSCQDYKLPAKILAIIDRSLTFIPNEKMEIAMSSDDIFKKFIYEDRSSYILESFNSNENYRKTLTEDIYELKEFLINKSN